jgi:EamA domain-containing membrane protein RarD
MSAEEVFGFRIVWSMYFAIDMVMGFNNNKVQAK